MMHWRKIQILHLQKETFLKNGAHSALVKYYLYLQDDQKMGTKTNTFKFAILFLLKSNLFIDYWSEIITLALIIGLSNYFLSKKYVNIYV